jgi:hypothetical protein
MMKKLLRKLVKDLPTLSEQTKVPLNMLTIWYERCGQYYGAAPLGMQASEEEKRYSMLLFTSIFDALANRVRSYITFAEDSLCIRVHRNLIVNLRLTLAHRLMIRSCSARLCHACLRSAVHYHPTIPMWLVHSNPMCQTTWTVRW